jgi:hypothetical protein
MEKMVMDLVTDEEVEEMESSLEISFDSTSPRKDSLFDSIFEDEEVPLKKKEKVVVKKPKEVISLVDDEEFDKPLTTSLMEANDFDKALANSLLDDEEPMISSQTGSAEKSEKEVSEIAKPEASKWESGFLFDVGDSVKQKELEAILMNSVEGRENFIDSITDELITQCQVSFTFYDNSKGIASPLWNSICG